MENILTIDGSQGEGGGQILRTSLSLSAITQTPFRMVNVRAKREVPGLKRQHLTCVRAVTEVCGAQIEGDEVGSLTLSFAPGPIRGGEYRFDVGTAGSTTLVAQTVLPVLLMADTPSSVTISGGTHVQWAPIWEFFAIAYLPQLRAMGAEVEAELVRHGFYPAAGGEIRLSIKPFEKASYKKALELVKKLELRTMIRRFSEGLAGVDVNAEEETPEDQKETVFEKIDDAEAFIEEASKAKEAGLQIAVFDGHVIGYAAAFGDRCGFVEGEDTSALKTLTKHVDRICTIDLKEQLYYLEIAEESRFFDCAIGAYLLNPLQGAYTYDLLSGTYAGRMIPSRAELIGKKKDKELNTEDWMRITCLQARAALESRQGIRNALEKQGMQKLFDEIEMPLVFVLYRMQREGILVKAEKLHEYGLRLSDRIDSLEKQIYEEAGQEFNINSPKQLGCVLFEDLHLPSGKKTKTGYSTAADVLEKLAEEHRIVADILEYRQLTKLRSTYAEGLSSYIAEDGRIHGKFNQTITATGRISSTDPNLQNIPVRTELGRELRKVFVPKEGSKFVDADYSQIELRVLAHMSGDKALIEAYNSAEDIHAITASSVFHVPLEEVTPQLRRNAKAVNFGIVYGISSFGLSQGLSITRKEAAQFIEQYFKTFPQIKAFLDEEVKSAKEQGWCVTMFGRRRPIPELKESNFMRRSFGERVAMNAPIQGTAADIIKIAMIGVDRRLREEGLKSRLVLQVHDELLVEAAESEVESVKQILREEMEGAANMKVRLEIDMHDGDSWYEAH